VGLISDIGEGPVALDTPVFIYFIEEHERYLPIVEPVFEAIDRGSLQAVTSGLTLMETLVLPHRQGDRRLAERYEVLLSHSRGLRLLELTTPLLRTAAQLRATLEVKTPDAIQLAAALHGGCSALLTNDRRLPEVPGLAVTQLSDYLS
jgi:predicted nucleic acid-binding protein